MHPPKEKGLFSLKIFIVIAMLFLPYLGNTTLRVDHLLPLPLIILLLICYIKQPSQLSKLGLSALFLTYSILFLYVFILLLVTTGPMRMLFNIPNSFLPPLAAIALAWYFRKTIINRFPSILYCLYLLSIPISLLTFIQFYNPTSPIVLKLLHLYTGGHKSGYGNFTNSTELILLSAHRPVSIFINPMCVGIFNLIITSLSIGSIKDTKINNFFLSTIVLLNTSSGLISSSKTFFFSLLITLVLILFMLKKRLNLVILMLSLLTAIVAIAMIFSESNRFINDYINIFTNGLLGEIFRARFSSTGYLVTSGAIESVKQPINFIFGQGRYVSKTSWSDSGYLQVMQVGGIMTFITYYSWILILCLKTKRNLKYPYTAQCWLAFYISTFFSNSGIFIYSLPRVSLLFFIINISLVIINSDYINTTYKALRDNP